MRLWWEPQHPGNSYIWSVAPYGLIVILLLMAVQGFVIRRWQAFLRDLARAESIAHSAQAESLAKSEFLANMSHELRTPLNAVLGFSELLGDRMFAAKAEEYAKLIHRAGAHLLRLIDDILDLSKIAAGKFELIESSFDVKTMVEECTAVLASEAGAHGLTLTAHVADHLPRIFADERALKQILLNLLSNAVKFSPPGGDVEAFAALAPRNEICIGVQDRGAGIPEEDQEHIFERFGQGRADVANAGRGTGLGLPIVKGLVHEHGGRIELDSGVEVGTRVTVYLPATRVLRESRAA